MIALLTWLSGSRNVSRRSQSRLESLFRDTFLLTRFSGHAQNLESVHLISLVLNSPDNTVRFQKLVNSTNDPKFIGGFFSWMSNARVAILSGIFETVGICFGGLKRYVTKWQNQLRKPLGKTMKTLDLQCKMQFFARIMVDNFCYVSRDLLL